MQVIHLGQKELAEHWRMSEATLERWLSDRIDPQRHAGQLRRHECQYLNLTPIAVRGFSPPKGTHHASR